jgi:hypothetical protein
VGVSFRGSGAHLVAGVVSSWLSFAPMPAAAQPSPTLYGPAPYVQTSDSPFAGTAFSWFHREDFEDHLLNTPGVTASGGTSTASAGYSGTIIDSVDADDGNINGHCVPCDAWFNPVPLVRFTFSVATLGQLPTHAGVVWTDGGGETTFEAFGPGGVSLGSVTGSHADPDCCSGAVDDRFYGVYNAAGIESIVIRNATFGIEVDHLQYGLAGTPALTLTSLTLKKPIVAGCKPVVGTVTLSAPAPAGGAVVTLSETLASGSVPASVTIPAGATSKTFKVTTTARADAEAGTVSATYGGTTLTKPLTVRPMSVLSIPITPTTLVGGGISSGVVKLECKAGPGPILVEFGSTLPAVAGTTVPNVLIPVGVQTAPVTVTTSPVTKTTKPKITATANGLTKSKTLTVTP